MSEKGKRILAVFAALLPDLTEQEQDKFLTFGEGIAFVIGQRRAERAERDSA